MYEISSDNRTCTKKPLKVEFQPMEIPKNASLLGQSVLGSSSGPGQGLLVNTWVGDLPDKSGTRRKKRVRFIVQPLISDPSSFPSASRKVHDHIHRVRMHSHQHRVPHGPVWMGGDEVRTEKAA